LDSAISNVCVFGFRSDNGLPTTSSISSASAAQPSVIPSQDSLIGDLLSMDLEGPAPMPPVKAQDDILDHFGFKKPGGNLVSAVYLIDGKVHKYRQEVPSH